MYKDNKCRAKTQVQESPVGDARKAILETNTSKVGVIISF